jgi:ferredoxin
MPVADPRAPEPVSPPWETLVLVCEKCKGARRGPDAHGIRKGLKQRIGKHKSLRVMESPCMSVCPDDAVTVCISRTQRATEVVLVRSEAELDALAEALR